MALKFDRHFGSSAAEILVIFQNNTIIITPISRFRDLTGFRGKTSYRSVNRGSKSSIGNALEYRVSGRARASHSSHEPMSGACVIHSFCLSQKVPRSLTTLVTGELKPSISFYPPHRSWSFLLACRSTYAVPVTQRRSGGADEGPRPWVPQPRSCALCRTSLASPSPGRTWRSVRTWRRRTVTPRTARSRWWT